MEQLKQLKQAQKQAIKSGNFAELSAINEKIYKMRQSLAQERKKIREKLKDEKFSQRIEKFLDTNYEKIYKIFRFGEKNQQRLWSVQVFYRLYTWQSCRKNND